MHSPLPYAVAPPAPNEGRRLAALRAYDVLDTAPEQAYDDLVHLAAEICGTPMALVSLVDEDRQWFKARIGLDASETPRDVAFCAHAIHEPEELFVVENALHDPRFAENPLVVDEPAIRFYAGMPLRDRAGETLGTLCVLDRVERALDRSQRAALKALARQVTSQLELRRSNARLREAYSTLQGFSGSAAHDLQAPLRTICGLLQLVEDESPGISDEGREYLDLARRASARGTELVNGLLAYASVLAPSLPAEWVCVETEARNTMGEFHERIARTGATSSYESLPCVWGSKPLLAAVFRNLFGNALKYRREDTAPHIRVTGVQTDLAWSFRIADNGIGIEGKYLERIFEPFGRLHPKHVYEGSGIGLATARRAASAMGGTLHAESTPGRGSTFVLTLPRMEGP